jgi:hypothetical protein
MYVISNKITSIRLNPFLTKTTFMKQLLFLLVLSTSITHVSAQNSECKVLLDSIKGSYTGECKNGKAEGTGTAIGTDTYAGEFKNGKPEGKGKYTWANGDYYFGGWKKGLKDGKGELHLPVNGVDSVIYGYWSKGVYKGKYERPYIIHNTSSNIGRIDVSKIKSGSSKITIEVLSSIGSGTVTSTNSTSNQGVAAATSVGAASLTEIRLQAGSYISKFVTKLSNKEINVLQNVIFPFKAILVFGNSMVELEILEDSEWTVVVPVQQQ